MGRLHSRIYSQMETVDLVGVVDIEPEKAKAVAKEYGTVAFEDYAEVIDKVDAVTISAPTESHYAVAEPFLKRGIAVLVEKPLADSLESARQMLETSRANNCILQVGYSERFNPIGQAMKRINFTPRVISANRISPYTFRSTDVGVVLDVMIHDLDIILSMTGGEVKMIQAVGVNVLGEHEDIADVRLTFANGCVANLTASRLALKTERKIRVFSEDAYLSLDYLKKTGTMISRAGNIDMLQELRKQTNDKGEVDLLNADWTQMVNVETLDIDGREPLRLEQEAFIQAVTDGCRPEVSAEDAVAAMELAELIVQEIANHKWDGYSGASLSAQHWQ